ncbi:tol-pal system-associated acyl-CoA thioesterase [Castellaniella caeni]|uniref:tol-pal system-associated acyl-CoA thioesterase n=1 Tax=Castellaniella caeni TaxID=266123 RepID=UPI000C9FCE37|nr:tol-pal system-associated acyl-CoA thioesterase [Castellaniella caeni]
MTLATSNATGELAVRVYYEDTDTGGVVYYANYLKFFERARTEWLRALGMDQRQLAAQEQMMFVVRHAEIAYRQPARLDDLIHIRTTVADLRASTLVFHQQALRDGELLASASVQVCTVHATTFKPIRLSPSIRDLLNKALR